MRITPTRPEEEGRTLALNMLDSFGVQHDLAIPQSVHRALCEASQSEDGRFLVNQWLTDTISAVAWYPRGTLFPTILPLDEFTRQTMIVAGIHNPYSSVAAGIEAAVRDALCIAEGDRH